MFDEQQVKDELEAAITALRTEVDRSGAERRRLARRCALLERLYDDAFSLYCGSVRVVQVSRHISDLLNQGLL